MNKTFERNLPEGYEVGKIIDATDKKTVLIMNIACIMILLLIVVPAYFLINFDSFLEEYLAFFHGFSYWYYLMGLVVYIIGHEIVHGIAYKLLTKEKLTFGLTLSVAYCGVPDIYTYRKTTLIALLAPFVVFNILFIGLLFICPTKMDLFCMSVLLGLHNGGCVGDLYDAYLFLFKFKDPSTLVNDNGPKQVIYVKKSID